jgi:hypothetical protein
MSEPKIGDIVRSHDFIDEDSLYDGKACYVVGKIVAILPGPPHGIYKIKPYVTIENGRVCSNVNFIYPPVNGLATTKGRITDFVRVIEEAKAATPMTNSALSNLVYTSLEEWESVHDLRDMSIRDVYEAGFRHGFDAIETEQKTETPFRPQVWNVEE